MRKFECFKIQIYDNLDSNNLELSKMKSIYRVHGSSWSRLLEEPTSIVADPFLFVWKDTLYLFYEYKKLYQNALIKMVSTKDLQTWTSPITVLQERIHLSYPFVFEENGEVYMVPETCAMKSVRLYKASDNQLTNFSFVRSLIEENKGGTPADISFSDSSILKKENMYYLHTTVNYGGINELRLYISEKFDGPYREHKMSPIVKSQKYGRNGGSLITYHGKLVRIAQDCVNRYGDNIHLMNVDLLTPNDYNETVMQEFIYNTKIDFYKEGGHHLNIVEFKNKQIISTDAKEYHYFFLARIMHKLGHLGRR